MKLSSATQTTALVIMFELSPLKVHWENCNGEIIQIYRRTDQESQFVSMPSITVPGTCICQTSVQPLADLIHKCP